MSYIRKNKKLSIIILIVLIINLTISFSFSKYIKNIINNFILETKAFYFNSSILKVNGKNLYISNWDGVNQYTLTIDLNNRKGLNKTTSTDIVYDITVECPDTVICNLSKNTGVIHKEDETDNYQITVIPKQNFHENDEVRVKTEVTSREPYRKTMSATYTIGVETSKFSYKIEDSINSKYLTATFTNSIPYYEVETAFGNHQEHDLISLDDYNNLNEQDKEKCFSAVVTLEFDPNIIVPDMTSNYYLKRLNSNYQEVQINNYNYVSKFSFKVNASSSNSIIFYKNDIEQNYTYPIINDTSIINVEIKTAK